MRAIAELFRRDGPQYRATFGDRMPPRHLHAMADIEQCRTETRGGHVYDCEPCQESQYRDHSCKHRHCPTCQNAPAQAWLDTQNNVLLPVPYVLVTFTLPEGLRKVARSHQKIIDPLLFRRAAAALQPRAFDPRCIGGHIGMIGILHTWTRDLRSPPHVHVIVPGGGLSPDEQTWLPSREDFLVPVEALSRIFQAKFRHALQQTPLFDLVPADTWKKDWVVHSQPVSRGVEA